jgi:hypothetical protein
LKIAVPVLQIQVVQRILSAQRFPHQRWLVITQVVNGFLSLRRAGFLADAFGAARIKLLSASDTDDLPMGSSAKVDASWARLRRNVIRIYPKSQIKQIKRDNSRPSGQLTLSTCFEPLLHGKAARTRRNSSIPAG